MPKPKPKGKMFQDSNRPCRRGEEQLGVSFIHCSDLHLGLGKQDSLMRQEGKIASWIAWM